MEEINNVSTGNYDDWSDIDFSDITDSSDDFFEDDEAIQTEEEPAPDTEAEEEANHSEEAEAEEEPEETEPEPTENKETDQRIPVKYMGEEKLVSREEAIPFIQMGMDYGRIKGKLEEANQLAKSNAEMAEFVKTLASEMGLEPAAFMLEVQAGNIAKKENISIEEAKRKLELDRREKAIAAKEQEAQSKNEAADAENAKREKIRAELAEFAKAFPEVKADSIPAEVFQMAAKQGVGLTAAYAMHEAKLAKAALEAEKQNAKNKALAVGSASTSGKRRQVDEFDALWYDGN